MTTPAPTPRWRAVIVTTLLPTLLFTIGEGAVLPIIPVVASQLGADLAGAGLVSSLLVIGSLVGTIPSGVLISRIGERVAMIGAAALSIVAAGVGLVAPHPVVLGVAVFLIGLSAAIFGLARHAFLTSVVPFASRARALSTLGGTFRLGFLIGPFVTAAFLSLTGATQSVFWLLVIGSALAILVLVVVPDPEAMFGLDKNARRVTTNTEGMPVVPASLGQTLREKRTMLATLGVGAAMITALRASRVVVVPLWAVAIGVDETTTAVVIGIAAAIDFALFYTGGWIMDRFGRLWVAVPSLIGLGLCHLVLAASDQLPNATVWWIGVTFAFALANGIGAGIMMTLGSDLADRRNPAPFLGAWRFVGNLSSAVIPLLLAGLTAVASLPIAVAAVGLLGLGGAAMVRVFLPRYIPRRRD